MKTASLLAVTLVLGLAACVPPDSAPTAEETVEHAWALLDQRYALFVDKDVDWPGAREAALAALDEGPPDDDALFFVLTDLVDVLDDGHVNVVAPFNVSWSTSHLEARTPTWDLDLVQRHVLDFDFQRRGSALWSLTPEGWGYLRIDDFVNLPATATLDLIFDALADADGLVVDLRSNGGGELEQAAALLSRLIAAPQIGWHVEVVDGPEHDDLGEPTPRIVEAARPGYHGPLALLVDGRTYSAANTVAFALAGRPRTVIVGQPTGGGAGSPTWHELPNGWALRFPTRRLTDPGGAAMEAGMTPTVLAGPDPTAPTEDRMIEAAVVALVGL